MSELTETQAIAVLRTELERSPQTRGSESAAVRLGIGDDAAVLSLRGKHVWSIDCCTEGVHFDRAWLSLGQAAGRAFEAAVSDLAAMGATPIAALCNLQVPASVTQAELRQVGRGQAAHARRTGCPLLGGNVSSGQVWQFTTSVLGAAARPLLRSGARPGDELWLLGSVGEAAAGLRLLQRASRNAFKDELVTFDGKSNPNQPTRLRRAVARCLRAWRQPRALLQEGVSLVGRASSAIDVSDGIASESRHLSESGSNRIVVDASQLRATASSELRRVAESLQLDPLELMLHGGEDFALLATGPAGRRPAGAQVIGLVEAGRGVTLRTGQRRRRLQGGYDHLRS